jgi:hypothetical protein
LLGATRSRTFLFGYGDIPRNTIIRSSVGQEVRQLQNVVKITEFVLAMSPALVVGGYCVVAALASRIEDKVIEDVNMRSSDTSIDARDLLRDLPKAA